MDQALAYKRDHPDVSFAKLSEMFNIPTSTLYDRYNGTHARKGERVVRNLSLMQEAALIDFINKYADKGYVLSPGQIRGYAEMLAKKPVGVNWTSTFLRRRKGDLEKYHSLRDRVGTKRRTRLDIEVDSASTSTSSSDEASPDVGAEAESEAGTSARRAGADSEAEGGADGQAGAQDHDAEAEAEASASGSSGRNGESTRIGMRSRVPLRPVGHEGNARGDGDGDADGEAQPRYRRKDKRRKKEVLIPEAELGAGAGEPPAKVKRTQKQRSSR